MAGTTLVQRQSDLVNEYAEDMAIHVGDERELALCHKEFKKKIGPKLYRESMFKVREGRGRGGGRPGGEGRGVYRVSRVWRWR